MEVPVMPIPFYFGLVPIQGTRWATTNAYEANDAFQKDGSRIHCIFHTQKEAKAWVVKSIGTWTTSGPAKDPDRDSSSLDKDSSDSQEDGSRKKRGHQKRKKLKRKSTRASPKKDHKHKSKDSAKDESKDSDCDDTRRELRKIKNELAECKKKRGKSPSSHYDSSDSDKEELY
jgi:hypothetical protein